MLEKSANKIRSCYNVDGEFANWKGIVMISDLEKLVSALRGAPDTEEDDAHRLANKIKSDPQIQRDLEENGCARVTDDEGRTFVVKRKNVAAAAVS
jgi:hypothetical protein